MNGSRPAEHPPCGIALPFSAHQRLQEVVPGSCLSPDEGQQQRHRENRTAHGEGGVQPALPQQIDPDAQHQGCIDRPKDGEEALKESQRQPREHRDMQTRVNNISRLW